MSPCQMSETSKPGGERWNLSSALALLHFFCQVTWAGFCSADVNPALWLALLLHRDPWHLPQGYGFWWRNQAPVHFRELVIVMWKL